MRRKIVFNGKSVDKKFTFANRTFRWNFVSVVGFLAPQSSHCTRTANVLPAVLSLIQESRVELHNRISSAAIVPDGNQTNPSFS